MKRKSIIYVSFLDFFVNIAAAFSYFKDFCMYFFCLGEADAATINATIFIIAFLILIICIIWLYIDKKLSKAGTREIPCTISAYKIFKIDNMSNKILRNIHCKMYHEIVKFKKTISKAREEKIKSEQNDHLEYKDFNDDFTDILDKFHSILNDVFKLDLSINVYISTEEKDNKILTRWIFIQNEEERDLGEQRDKERNYIFHDSNNKDLEGYAISSKNHFIQKHNGDYWANSVFDYLMTSNKSSFMSNDLRLDEKEGRFYTTNEYYTAKNRYNSLAAFAIIPPSKYNNISQVTKGILTFDTTKTNVFSERECTMLMGLMAHYLFEILEFIKNPDYAEKISTGTVK